MHTVMHRALVVLVGPGLMIGACVAPLRAQGPSPDTGTVRRAGAPFDASLSECLRAIPESAGILATAYLGVPASDSVPVALRDQVGNFTAVLGDEMRRSMGAAGDTLPYVSRRISGVAPTSVELVVRRNGTFDWSVSDTALWSRHTRELLLDALQASRKAGEMIVWPAELPGDSARVRLRVEIPSLVNGKLVGDEVLPLALPVFTTRVLVEKPAAVKHAVIPTYPERNRSDGWVGTVDMQFVVDTTGHAVDSTMKSIWPKGVPLPKPEQMEVYTRFMRAAVEGARRSTYYPAELAGCKVRQVVQQSFNFNIGTHR